MFHDQFHWLIKQPGQKTPRKPERKKAPLCREGTFDLDFRFFCFFYWSQSFEQTKDVVTSGQSLTELDCNTPQCKLCCYRLVEMPVKKGFFVTKCGCLQKKSATISSQK
jgi:hypothetical protein